MKRRASSVGIFCVYLFLTACISDTQEVDRFVNSYSHVQPLPNVNGLADELLWINNDQVLSYATVRREGRYYGQGLFIIDSSGVTDLVIRGAISQFCMVDERIYVESRKGLPELIKQISGYKIHLAHVPKSRKTDKNHYSPSRCKFVDDLEAEQTIYRTLKEEDGFLEVTFNNTTNANTAKTDQVQYTRSQFYKTRKSNGRKPVWVVNVLNPKKDTRVSIEGLWPIPPNVNFKQFAGAYFGYSNSQETAHLWKITRENWTVEYQKFDYPREFINNGSRVFELTRAGYILEHHSQKRGGLYLLNESKLTLLERGQVRSASVSPDGCNVAFVAQNKARPKKDKWDLGSALKIIDICAFKDEMEQVNDGN